MTDYTLLTDYINEARREPLGTIVRKPLCPFCGHRIKAKGFVVSRTNKGILCWCHRCHKSRRKSIEVTPPVKDCLQLARKHITTELVTKSSTDVQLPYDVTCEIPLVASQWLRKYHVTQTEIKNYGICWSPSLSRLIFPVRDKDLRLVYWQGRYFGTEPEAHAKYYNVCTSRKQVWFDTGDIRSSHTIVLVEDVLSSIAVARVKGYRSIALLGCYLNDDLIIKLQSESKQVCVWLDPDKRCTAWRYCKRLNVFGIKAKAVYTDDDPKVFTRLQIATHLEGRKEEP